MTALSVYRAENGFTIHSETKDDHRTWVAYSVFEIYEVMKELWEPPAIPAPPENPLDAICQRCGERKGEHSATGLNCPMPPESMHDYAQMTFQAAGEEE